MYVHSYGRVYTTDPYHALTPAAAAAYGVGAMVRKQLAQDIFNKGRAEPDCVILHLSYLAHVMAFCYLK